MKASEAIVVLTDMGVTLGMNKDEIFERLSGGEQSNEIFDLGYSMTASGYTKTWTIVRTRHAGDDRGEQAAKELA